MNHTPKISFDGCGLNDANDPYKRRLFTAEDWNESRSIGMYIEQACNVHEELLRELKSAIFYIETYGGDVTKSFSAGGNMDAVKAIIAKAEGKE